MLPRPLQESGVVGKGGTAGFLGRAYDPYTLYPDGDDMDMTKMDRIKIEDLQLRPEVFALRLQRRAKLRDALNAGMPEIDQAVADFKLNEYYDRALSLIVSGRAREAFNLQAESPQTATCMAARRSVRAVCWPADWSRPAPRSSRSSGPKWRTPTTIHGTSRRFDQPDARPVGPHARPGALGPLIDMDQRGLLDETLVVAVGEFGRSPQKGISTSGNGNSADGRDHWPYCYTAVMAGAGIRRGMSMASPTRPAPLPSPTRSTRASCWLRFITASASTRPPSSITTSTSPRAGQGRRGDQAVCLSRQG